uniref:Uncharacterized protein n=1 Tax=Arundo donax TaxID=35708 RepID=A0A0A9AX94_ARUDO
MLLWSSMQAPHWPSDIRNLRPS